MAGLVPAIHVLLCERKKDVDARAKRGHDENSGLAQRNPPSPGDAAQDAALLRPTDWASLRGALATKQSSLGLGLLGRSLRPRFSHRKIGAEKVHKRYHDGYGEQYVALIQDHAFIFRRCPGGWSSGKAENSSKLSEQIFRLQQIGRGDWV
jgi:hypothetical protein